MNCKKETNFKKETSEFESNVNARTVIQERPRLRTNSKKQCGQPSENCREPESLLDLSAKVAARKIPFQSVEELYPRIPEPVLKKIIFWSFPRDEKDIFMYSSFTNRSNKVLLKYNASSFETPDLPYYQGIKLLERNCVDSVLQIGFHLSGNVDDSSTSLYPESDKTYQVSISFDRCKITCIKCSCEVKDIFWCSHVVALALYRIRKPFDVCLRVPISESLQQMSRDQLQKFAQYLIAEHHWDVLPTAQRLADQLTKQPDSAINRVAGAPDPTAGSIAEGQLAWHLDEQQVSEKVKALLSVGAPPLLAMFDKVREMLRAGDSNAARMLTLMTQQFLVDPQLLLCQMHALPLPEHTRVLWQHLSSLWTCVVLDPSSSQMQRSQWLELLSEWASSSLCPHRDPDSSTSDTSVPSILQPALEACQLSWDSTVLVDILTNPSAIHLWPEEIGMASSRVDALKSHGNHVGALRLAVAIIHNLQELSRAVSTPACPGWIGHDLDPISCLFGVLLSACQTSSSGSSDSSVMHTENENSESYLCLAVDCCILSLSQQRILPTGRHASQRCAKHEQNIIQKLQSLEFDSRLLDALANSARLLLANPSSGFSRDIPSECVPMHSLARLLVDKLTLVQPDLALDIGLRAMQLTPLVNWTAHARQQQAELASKLLSDWPEKLAEVLQAVLQYVQSPTTLFKLGRDVLKRGVDDGNLTLMHASLEMGLRVAHLTLSTADSSRRDLLPWLLSCASHLGFPALLNLINDWHEYFTPLEASGTIATGVMAPVLSSSDGVRKLSDGERSQLRAASRQLALACARQDPANCCLAALRLCEDHPVSFEAAYKLVIDTANGGLSSSSQLFIISRYMDHRGFAQRAYELALLAMRGVHLAYNQDTHPVINDVHWAVALAQSLGRNQLSSMLPLLTKNVQCATVLYDVLCRFTVGSADRMLCRRGSKPFERPPFRQLLDAAICAYVNTTHSRLMHISPRHYVDFLDFLQKAQECFRMAPDGMRQFTRLIDNMKLVYKGKKKLILLIKERFGL